ncbi:MAG: TolC family outer membrane protein [Rhodospirillales bacterium]|nr:TolC family outer membrane protein [Rhodospirillales bacterium]
MPLGLALPMLAPPLLIAPALAASHKPAPPATAAVSTAPNTLTGALIATYQTQPALLAERAKLRATDEGVPQALSGWRPTVVVAGSTGYGDGMSRTYSGLSGGYINNQTDRLLGTAQATVTQPIYTGGKVQANLNKAKNSDMAERANLLQQEETSFTDTVNAYVGVIEAQEVLALNVNNEQVLAHQLAATNDRFQVGEITRTDVAQAQAALAGATAQRQTAEGNLQTARATFQRVIGYAPPAHLIEPQPLALPVRNENQAGALAASNNPQVVAALFNDASAKDAVDVAFSQLLPQVSLQGQVFQSNNAASRSSQSNGYQVVANLSVPLYQGGAEYSSVRQAKQSEQQAHRLIDDARRTAVQSSVAAWQTLVAARAAAASTRSAITANQIALDGVEREAIVGSRTTQDVLNAQQALLSSEVTLVQNVAQVVTASYQVASAIGRLTARDLRLPVPYYDDTAYYKAVKDKWAGLGDYATSQPDR